jgi:hypothetical protein
LEEESVAETVLAIVEVVGTVKATKNEPTLLVVVVPVSVSGEPFHVAVTVFEPPNPIPVIVTVEPGVPEGGTNVMNGVTVKVAVAERAPSLACIV